MRLARHNPRKPPVINQNLAAMQRDLAWRFIDRRYDDTLTVLGPAVCTRCHAYLETDHWLYDDQKYLKLQEQENVHRMLCPGCERVEKRLYEGEVTIRDDWNDIAKQDLLNLIHHEEARARATNPTARIAVQEDRGNEIYLLTTTQFLAERIGREIHKAFHGKVTVTPLPRERFTRVLWTH